MFSSDASASAFVPGMFAPALAPATREAPSATTAWFPDDVDLSSAFGGDDPYNPLSGEIAEAVRAALAARAEQETFEREQSLEDAYAAGIETGRAEAAAASQAAIASAVEALWLAVEEVRVAESRWTVALQDNVAALAAAAARHVIGREVATDDTLVCRLAARAVEEYPQGQPLHIRVNAADLATLRDAFATTPRAAELRWIADPRVERGGCVVEGRERIVDGRVDTALERVYRRLSGHSA